MYSNISIMMNVVINIIFDTDSKCNSTIARLFVKTYISYFLIYPYHVSKDQTFKLDHHYIYIT